MEMNEISSILEKKIVLVGTKACCEYFIDKCKYIFEIVGRMNVGQREYVELFGEEDSWFVDKKLLKFEEITNDDSYYIVVCMPNVWSEEIVYKQLYGRGLYYGKHYLDYYMVLFGCRHMIETKINISNKIVIWGTKNRGRKIYFDLKDKYDIVGFTDSSNSSTIIDNIEYIMHGPILQSKISNIVIMVASTFYNDIREMLIAAGYKEFVDFFPAEMYEVRKLLLFHGTCQTMSSIKYLSKRSDVNSRYFVRRYHVLNNIHPAMQEKWDYCIGECGAIVYNNGSIGGELVGGIKRYQEKLASDVKLIAISSYEFKGQIQQSSGHFDNNAIDLRFEKRGGLYWITNDKNIKRLVELGKSKEEIMELISADNFYQEKEVLNTLSKELRKVEMSDLFSDVKLYTFVRENCKRKLLFSDGIHFMPCLSWEIASQLIELLELQDCTTDIMEMELEKEVVDSFPVYPSVEKSLGLPSCQYFWKHVDYEEQKNVRYDIWDLKKYVEYCYDYNVAVKKIKDIGVWLG